MPGLLPTIEILLLGSGLAGLGYATRRAWRSWRTKIQAAERARIDELLSSMSEATLEKSFSFPLPPPRQAVVDIGVQSESVVASPAAPPPIPQAPRKEGPIQTVDTAVQELMTSVERDTAQEVAPASKASPSQPVVAKDAATHVAVPVQRIETLPPTVLPQSTATNPTDARNIPRPEPISIRWIAPGESIQLAGHTISCGMFYVAKGGSQRDEWWPVAPEMLTDGVKTKLDDEQLRGHLRRLQTPGTPWVSYLRWLQSERQSLFVDAHAVCKFVQGLAVRLLSERSAPERAGLTAELKRLQTILPVDTHGLAHYLIARLLPLVELAFANSDATQLKASTDRTEELSPITRVAIGQLLKQGRPIPFEWMLAWYLESPEGYVRTPAQRAPEEFRAVVANRFARAYPAGMQVEAPRARFRVEFGSRDEGLKIELTEYGVLPDIAGYQNPLNRMRKLIEEATDALDGYSRFIGRYPDQQDSLAALHLLPAETVGSTRERSLSNARQWLAAQLNASGTADIDALSQFLLSEKKERYTGKTLQRMAELLSLAGHGMEPDPLYGSSSVSSGERVWLFPVEGTVRPEPTPSYRSAVVLAETLVSVAKADGTIAPEEKAAAERIGPMMRLGPSELVRLRVHIERLCASEISFSTLKKKLGELPEELRHTVARFAVSVAAADGVIEKAEIRLLEKLYDELTLPRSALFSDLHEASARAATPASEPVVIATATPETPKNRVPMPPAMSEPAPSHGLDEARLQRILAETEQVSAVLGRIFQEQQEDPALAPVPSPVESKPSRYEGLDAQHGELLEALLTRTTWTRDEYVELARQHKLMPDGALETINEWSFEQHDEALIEDGNSIEINRSLLSAA